MKNVKEISDYLGLDGSIDNSNLLGIALTIEAKYGKELESGWYGYGLLCDFNSKGGRLEDIDYNEKLEPVEVIDGIIVYKIIKTDY